MIEIDPGIMNAEDLYEKIKISAMQKHIPEEFYGETYEGSDGTLSIDSIHAEMVKVYQNLQMMNATWVISEVPITTQKKYIGKLVIFLKKIFRKLTRWLFRSYYEQQTSFNGAATRPVSDMIRVQEMMIKYCENIK